MLGTAITATGAAGVGAARAFSWEEASEPVQQLYEKACTERSIHEKLHAELQAMLQDEQLAQQVKARLLEGVTCPICSCNLKPQA